MTFLGQDASKQQKKNAPARNAAQQTPIFWGKNAPARNGRQQTPDLMKKKKKKKRPCEEWSTTDSRFGEKKPSNNPIQ